MSLFPGAMLEALSCRDIVAVRSLIIQEDGPRDVLDSAVIYMGSATSTQAVGDGEHLLPSNTPSPMMRKRQMYSRLPDKVVLPRVPRSIGAFGGAQYSIYIPTYLISRSPSVCHRIPRIHSPTISGWII